MKKTIKLLAIMLIIAMLMPFTVVNATSTSTSAKVEKVVEKLKSSGLFDNITGKYENDILEFKYTVSIPTEKTVSFSVDGSVIKYESGDITNYDEAKDVISHADYFKEFIMETALKLNGYTEQQINDFFESESNNLNYELNGIEILEIGGDKTFTSDNENEGDITTPAMSMKIDLGKANLKTSSSDEKVISGTTVDEVIEAINSNSSFKIDNRISASTDAIDIIHTDYIDEEYTVSYSCKDGILTYETGDIANFDEACEAIEHEFFALSLIQYVLEVNGYTEEQIDEFIDSEDSGFDFEQNGIEILKTGDDKTFTRDGESVMVASFSIKIDFERANIEQDDSIKYNVLAGDKQIYIIGEDTDLTFEFDIDYDDFNTYADIWIDETRVEEDNFTSKIGSDSTILKFNDAFTNTLSEGDHHLEVVLSQGRLGIAKTDFSILKVDRKIVEYTIDSVTDSGDSISFLGKELETYTFHIRNLKDTTDEQIQEVVDLFNSPDFTFDILKEQLNKYIEYGKNAANGKGDLLKLYEMYLYNNGKEIHEVEGGFKLKIKMTDDMNEYDSYKLVYIAEDGTIEDAIELVKNEEYLEGTLSHLSMYALVGSKTETTTTNPTTGDNIIMTISIFAIAILGAYTTLKLNKNRKMK